VLQFLPGETLPALTLGERFRPGDGETRLCQPTAVAVATSGQVFVADGYCNHRVLIFNQQGRLMGLIPRSSGEIKACLHAPHTPAPPPPVTPCPGVELGHPVAEITWPFR
jgi:hypothetical protein